jgi:predicted Zn finger-like uncharacterized protein
MSMITGCPACGTMFRVVPDQLKISQGWVRCGHCGDVFDATAHLQDEAALSAASPMGTAVPPPEGQGVASQADSAHAPRPQDAPPVLEGGDVDVPLTDEPPAQPPATPQDEPPPARSEGVAEAFRRYAAEERPDISAASSGISAAGASVAPSAAAETRPGPLPEAYRLAAADEIDLDFSAPPARLTRESPHDSIPASEPPIEEHGYLPVDVLRREAEASVPATPHSRHVPLDEPDLDDVSFVQQARRKAWWRRPAVRALLVLLGLFLGALLALQVAVHDRDRLAASRPGLRPWLERLCGALGCSIAPPRRIDAIVIDSSGFTRLRPDAYRLTFTLRNQAQQPVAVPSLELTLTDSQDQPVLRRVLAPREMGAAADTIPPASDWSGSVALAVEAGTRVAGYRLLAFYP